MSKMPKENKQEKRAKFFIKKNKKEKERNLYGSDLLKRKRNKHDVNTRKYHEELLAQMEEVAEIIMDGNNKLTTFAREYFRQASLREKQMNNEINK